MPVKQISTTIPNSSNAQLQALDRQRQLAMLLQNQALRPLDGGRMVGNHFVPNHPAQGVAKMAQMLVGNYKQGQADRKQKQLSEEQRQALLTGLQSYGKAIQGTPAIEGRPEQHAVPEQGNPNDIWTGGNTHVPAQPYQPAIAGQPAQPPTKEQMQQAALALMGNEHPMAQQFGATQYANAMKPPELMVVPKGGRLANKQTGEIVAGAQNTGEIEPLSSFGKILADRDKFPKGSPEWNRLNQKLIKDSTHKPSDKLNVTNIQKEQSASAKEIGTGLGKQFNEIQNKAIAADDQLTNLDRAEELMGDFEGNAFTGVAIKAAELAKGFGIDLDPNLGDKQAALSLANSMAIKMRPPASGVMTDKDFEVFYETVPNIKHSARGRKLIIETFRKKLQRDQKIAEMAQNYYQLHGKFDYGFHKIAREHIRNNPVFPKKAEVDAYMNKGKGKINLTPEAQQIMSIYVK